MARQTLPLAAHSLLDLTDLAQRLSPTLVVGRVWGEENSVRRMAPPNWRSTELRCSSPVAHAEAGKDVEEFGWLVDSKGLYTQTVR